MAGARKLRANQASQRGAKSLVNTFPFNVVDDHHEAHAPSQSLDSRIARQGEDEGAPDFGTVAEAGEKCIDKVEMVEETEYDAMLSNVTTLMTRDATLLM